MPDQSPTPVSPTGTSARTARPSRPCSTSSASTRSTSWPPRRSRRESSTRSPAAGAAPGLDRLPPAASEAEALAELRALADAEHRRGVDDRAGLLRHAHAAGAAAQHPGEPGLVHRLHAVSAGDQPGPAGSAAEFPDHGRRPDRPRDRQRIDARRGHRGRRGDDADAPCGARDGEPAGRRHRRVRPDRGGAGHPGQAVGHRDRHRRPARRPARRASSSASSPSCPGPAAGSPTGRRWSPRPTTAARWSPSVPTCWR